MTPPALEVRNLEAVYHGVSRVLRGVSLTVPPRTIVALLGPNGAGKTTTLRAISGLLPIHEGRITKGSVRLGGEDLATMPPEARVARGLGQVLEGRRILAELTIEENLVAGGWTQPARQVRSDLASIYDRFSILGDRRHQLAGWLSGGEQQMLAIARALIGRPEVLLLDEPSLGLAPRIIAEVADWIRRIAADGVAILLVEQNARLALELSDTATILENGRVVLEGSSSDLADDDDVREFYLGTAGPERSYRQVKHYRRRRRWLG